MTPKEKAEELVKKFDDFTVIWIEEETCYRSPKKAKEGALIAVDEIINDVELYSTYWQEVKQEINLL